MMFDDEHVMKLQDLLFVEVKISNYEHLNQTEKLSNNQKTKTKTKTR